MECKFDSLLSSGDVSSVLTRQPREPFIGWPGQPVKISPTWCAALYEKLAQKLNDDLVKKESDYVIKDNVHAKMTRYLIRKPGLCVNWRIGKASVISITISLRMTLLYYGNGTSHKRLTIMAFKPAWCRICNWFLFGFSDCAVCTRNLCGKVWPNHWGQLQKGIVLLLLPAHQVMVLAFDIGFSLN